MSLTQQRFPSFPQLLLTSCHCSDDSTTLFIHCTLYAGNMSQTPSPRHRPNFHLSLTPLLGTPNQIYHATPPAHTPFSTPHASSFGLTNYSPFRSAGLRPPTPYGGSVQFTPRSQRKANSVYGSYTLFRLKRIFTSRALVLLIVVVVGFFWWWRAGLGSETKIIKVGRSGFGLGSQLFEVEATKELQFFPAANPKIHVRRLIGCYCMEADLRKV